MKLKNLLLGILISIVAYISVFCFFVKKPILYGELDSMITRKYNNLKRINGKKFVILAGSNGRYSHSAKIIGKHLNMEAANLSITASISLDWQLELLKRQLKSGDVVYLPLEPHNYSATEKASARCTEGIYCLMYNKKEWLKMSYSKKYYTFCNADLFLIFEDILERAMLLANVKHRDKLQNQFGDEIGHTIERAKEYSTYINATKENNPYKNTIDTNAYSMKKLSAFLTWASNNNIRVFGGLPTLINTIKIPKNYINELEKFYQIHKQKFIVLDNNSQYENKWIYDTIFHLNIDGQKLHSEKVAQKIKEELNNF